MDLDTYKLQPSFRGLGRIRMLVATLFGLIFLNPPLLEIFSNNRESMLFGWPILLVYIFWIWLFLIVLVVWPSPRRYSERATQQDTESQSNQ